MHELSVAHALVETVVDAIAGADVVVREVHVRVGRLCGVVPQALEFCFDVVAEGTPIEGARLVVEPVEVVARCATCATDVQVEGTLLLVCPRCGCVLTEVLAGRELEVGHLVVDDVDDVLVGVP